MATAMTAYQSLLIDYAPRPIRTEREHRRALRKIEKLMTSHPGREESELIEVLATLIEQYESAAHPVPKNPPHRMLAHYIENRRGTKAEVARETGILRSTITNVLAGRRAISKANAVKLANYFGVPVSVFI